jgi:uncharacterized protein YbaR (Trm112 family)
MANTRKPQPLIIENPKQRAVSTAMCPRCHGKLWTDFELSEQEHCSILVCESCGVAFDLIPLMR